MNRTVLSGRTRRLYFVSIAAGVLLLLVGCGKSHSQEPERPHSVTLSWKPSTSSIVGYNVYRASPPGRPGVKLTPKPITETQYTDSTVKPGNSYSYTVTAVDLKGVESRPAAEVLARVPKP